MKRIYVGNLAPNTTERELQKMFQRYGQVEKAGVICKPGTGEQLGFGFVIMRNDVHGARAIRSLDGYNLNGQRINVLEAVPPRPVTGNGELQRPKTALDRLRAIKADSARNPHKL